jgi:hypothetical protein
MNGAAAYGGPTRSDYAVVKTASFAAVWRKGS